MHIILLVIVFILCKNRQALKTKLTKIQQ